MATSGIGRIVHFSPGRVRLRIAPSHRTPEVFDQLESLLANMPGVLAVETNLATGSVLIQYDPRIVKPSVLPELARELNVVFGDSKVSVGVGAVDWPSQLGGGALAKTAMVLAASSVGGWMAPRVGLSARVGSLALGVATVLVGRLAKRGARPESRRSRLGVGVASARRDPVRIQGGVG